MKLKDIYQIQLGAISDTICFIQIRWSVLDMQHDLSALAQTLLYKSYEEYIEIWVFIEGVRKIAKSDYSLCRVRPSARMEQLGSHWTNFYETSHFEFFENLSRKFKFH